MIELMECGHSPRSRQANGKCATCRRRENKNAANPVRPGYCTECRVRKVKKRYIRCNQCRGSEFDLCECGARKTKRAKRCSPCNLEFQQGEDHSCWKGGRVQLKDGYVRAWKPNHPRAVNGRYVLEHILVMEEKLGRHLFDDERVHHMNKVRNDNRPENLELWSIGHPAGARTDDLVIWAKEILERYDR